MKKFFKRIILTAIFFVVIFKVFPKIGLYTYIFDRGNYKNSYNPPDKVISDLDELTPKTKKLALKFLKRCEEKGLPVKITETYRTKARQEFLYSQGRTTEGPIVTWTKESKHMKRYAFDICKDGENPYGDEEFFKMCAEIGREVGLTPGYFWKEYKDMPHYEYNRWWTP